METDAPFLTPHPFRGAPNESYCLPYTVRALADILDRPAAEVARQTYENAVRTYRLTVCESGRVGTEALTSLPSRYRRWVSEPVKPDRSTPRSAGSGIFRLVYVLNKLHETRSPALRVLVGLLLLTLAFAGGIAVASQKTVTLTVDGSKLTVTTMKSRVIDVVEEHGYTVGERDDLFPAADTPLSEADTIVLRRSRPLQISMDGQRSTEVWTTAATVDEALAQLSLTDTAPAAASRGSRVPLAGMALPVVSAKTVHLNDGGQQRTVRLAAPTVGGLLRPPGRRWSSVTPSCRRPRRRWWTACTSTSPGSGSRSSPSRCRCRRPVPASKIRP